jgi:hypothetical protein
MKDQTKMSESLPELQREWAVKVAALITTLSTHYYREKELTDSQKALWMMAFVEDLSGRSLEVIARACKIYRQDAKNRWMATPGALLKIIRDTSLPVELPRRIINEENLISKERAESVIEATNLKYQRTFKHRPAEKIEVKNEPTPYIQSSPELVARAKALVSRIKKEQKEQEIRETQ